MSQIPLDDLVLEDPKPLTTTAAIVVAQRLADWLVAQAEKGKVYAILEMTTAFLISVNDPPKKGRREYERKSHPYHLR